MRWFRTRRKQIYLAIAGVFILGSFAGFGGYFVAESPFNAAILVDGRKIPYRRYQMHYERALEQRRQASQEPASEQERQMLRQQIVQSLVQQEVFLAEGERYGVRVSDAELGRYIESFPVFQKEGRFDPAAYRQVLSQIRLRQDEFEEEQRRELMIQRTQTVMAGGVRITSMELERAVQGLTAEERRNAMANPAGLRDQLFRKEAEASLLEWLSVRQPKVKVLINKIEGT